MKDIGECIEWTKYRTKKGYGTLGFKGKIWQIHRFVYTLFHGPIPKGMFVCHKCDNPSCYRIDHLFLGTPRDNVLDCINKGRRASTSGEKNPRSKLTEEQVSKIKELILEGNLTQKEIGEVFGISQSQISKIKLNQNWR